MRATFPRTLLQSPLAVSPPYFLARVNTSAGSPMGRTEQQGPAERVERASTNPATAGDNLRTEAYASFMMSDIYQEVFSNSAQQQLSSMGFPDTSIFANKADSTGKTGALTPEKNSNNQEKNQEQGKTEDLPSQNSAAKPAQAPAAEEHRTAELVTPPVEAQPHEDKLEARDQGKGESAEAPHKEAAEKAPEHQGKHGRKHGDNKAHEKHHKSQKHGHSAHKKNGRGGKHHKKHSRRGKGKHHEGSSEEDKENKNGEESDKDAENKERKPEKNKNGNTEPEKTDTEKNKGKEPGEKPNNKPEPGNTRKEEKRESKGDDKGKQDQPGRQDQPGKDQQRNDQPGKDQQGNDQSGKDQQGKDQPGKQDKPGEKEKPPEQTRPSDKQDANNDSLPDGVRVTRTADDLKTFYRHQDDGVSCSAFSIAMAVSDQSLGRPIQYGQESQEFKQLAGTTSHGYRGDLQSIADKLQTQGLDAKAYHYDRVGNQTMDDLKKELDQGHSAVARVINPHTGNPHYIYIAGRDQKGDYIIGDPDRHNTQHFKPVKEAHLQDMMSGRDGFVATWGNQSTIAASRPGTAAYRMAQLREQYYA